MKSELADLCVGQLSAGEIWSIVEGIDMSFLSQTAERIALEAFGPIVTYSPKVFIPLTRLCRDVCHYCTFATTPGRVAAPYLGIDEVVGIARSGARQGCREALFTLGDRPEDRFAVARDWLDRHGYASTVDYLEHAARAVFEETGLLPHLNPGILTGSDYSRLRPVSASMGIMLESTARRLCEPGGPHFGSPDKNPDVRLAAIDRAGEAAVPFTSGLLIGIGETRFERIEALCALRDTHIAHGHLQEIIIQNFRAKPDTKMAAHPDASLEEHLWTIAVARLIMPRSVSIQAPPNLRRDELPALLSYGVNDLGGVSPVTPDHVNPEAAWPNIAILSDTCRAGGRVLRKRLAIGPSHATSPERWLDTALRPAVLRAVDGRGLVRDDDWHAGAGDTAPALVRGGAMSPPLNGLIDAVDGGYQLSASEVASLFAAEAGDFNAIIALADRLRREQVGEAITYVVNRNINYTNICLYKCSFCAFSKGTNKAMRGPAYRLDLGEIARRTVEAAERGATEVCLQGGIHPDYDGQTYLDILSAVKSAVPGIHVHAFSALEVHHGATTLGMAVGRFLERLKEAGLASLPGTAAEILDVDVRSRIAPDKVTSAQWVEVMRSAHALGLRSTATIMFGHVDTYRSWADHLLLIRDLQRETEGFTEFVPLPFVHMEAPFWRKGQSRSGPTYREAILMHAIARIVLGADIPNLQVSWVKMGPDGAAAALCAGANDLGGVLMDESITRAAGGAHGQHFDQAAMADIAADLGRPLRQRTTLYGTVEAEKVGHHSRTDIMERI